MDFLTEYGLFFAKTLTFLIAVVLLLGFATAVGTRARKGDKGHLEVRSLNEHHEKQQQVLSQSLLGDAELKAEKKALKKRLKEEKKQKTAGDSSSQQRVFVLNFKGDMRASEVQTLREEVTAVLSLANDNDEIVVRLESPGGMVHSYGLASSQLDRVRKQGIPLTVCVDKVAASGGYMMACVADKILAAPFAYIGSIGVLAQLPNFHRLLKKHDVDFEVLTAGEYKRTLTMLGENTEKGREKFVQDLQETHDEFKRFVGDRRSKMDINQVATGEVWLGRRAQEVGLVDEVMTSDEYLVSKMTSAKVYEVSYVVKKSLQEKVGFAAEERMDSLLQRWWQRLTDSKHMS